MRAVDATAGCSQPILKSHTTILKEGIGIMMCEKILQRQCSEIPIEIALPLITVLISKGGAGGLSPPC